jgi:hypothetical protein
MSVLFVQNVPDHVRILRIRQLCADILCDIVFNMACDEPITNQYSIYIEQKIAHPRLKRVHLFNPCQGPAGSVIFDLYEPPGLHWHLVRLGYSLSDYYQGWADPGLADHRLYSLRILDGFGTFAGTGWDCDHWLHTGRSAYLPCSVIVNTFAASASL